MESTTILYALAESTIIHVIWVVLAIISFFQIASLTAVFDVSNDASGEEEEVKDLKSFSKENRGEIINFLFSNGELIILNFSLKFIYNFCDIIWLILSIIIFFSLYTLASFYMLLFSGILATSNILLPFLIKESFTFFPQN